MPSPDGCSADGAVPNTSTRRPAACRSPITSCAPLAVSTSGAPSTSHSGADSRRRALHFQRDENDTSSATTAPSLAMAAATASSVSFRPAALAANRPSMPRTSSSAVPSSGITSTSVRLPSVSVPVLSRQTVSTLASDSTAFRYWTSIPRRVSRAAAIAKVRLVSSTRPSGTRVTMPAVAVAADSRNGTSRWISAKMNSAPSGTMTTTSRVSRRLICTSSGERSCACSRASPSSCWA